MSEFGHKVKIIKTDARTAEIYVDGERFTHVREYEVRNAVNEPETVSLTFYASSVEMIDNTSEKEES